ncbi:MAG: M23 family metallopeptidase [Spongiibacteraceae bacterium]|jgi:murein DD-endopeptidase MepM/ murein hydrolase activator NlpD|nr:M23 family metallopeptidase [Spongiibacteraceae bacterium]
MPRIAVTAALLLLCAVPSLASVYKYQDASGVWQYSDQRPAAREVAVLTLTEAPAAERQVRIERRGDSKTPRLVAINELLAPAEVKFWLTEAENLHQPADFAVSRVVPPRGEVELVQLQPQRADQPLRYRYKYRWQMGDPGAQHTSPVYLPPVPHEGRFTISQAFDGGFSHSSPSSRYAIDIPMAEGTPVRAARAGQVVSTRMDSQAGGNSPEYRSAANTIYVLHDDGTYGVYAHLRYQSALVEPGERVEAGQIIAQSGNTGFSTGPHLHFAVLRNAGMRWESEPFELALPGGPVTPVRGLALNGTPADQIPVDHAFGQPAAGSH